MGGPGSGRVSKQLGLEVTANAKQAIAELNKVVRTTREIRKTSMKSTQSVSTGFNAAGTQIRKTTSQVKDFRSKFNFAFLSTMFFGMQLQRTFGGLIKSAVAGFKEIAGATHPINVAFARLDANVNFLKFAMMDAFGTDLINRLANFAGRIGNLPAEKLKELADTVVTLAFTGFMLFTVSQLALVYQGVKSMVSDTFIMSNWLGQKITNNKNFKISKGGFFLGAMGFAFAVDATIRSIKILRNDGTTMVDMAMNMGEIALAGALIGAMVGGPIGAAVGGTIGLTIGAIINVVDVSKEKKANRTFSELVADREKLEAKLKKLETGGSGLGADIGKLVFGDTDKRNMELIKQDIEDINDLIFQGFEKASGISQNIDFFDLEAAKLISSTTKDEISNLANTIATDLKPAFKEINVPLNKTKTELAEINTNTNNFLKATDDFSDSTGERTLKVNALASALFNLASAQAASNRVEQEELTEVPSVSVSGING